MSTPVEWLDAAGFAARFGISDRAARSAMAGFLEGKAWRGILPRTRHAERNGRGRRGYEVLAADLPTPADVLQMPNRVAANHDSAPLPKSIAHHDIEQLPKKDGRASGEVDTAPSRCGSNHDKAASDNRNQLPNWKSEASCRHPKIGSNPGDQRYMKRDAVSAGSAVVDLAAVRHDKRASEIQPRFMQRRTMWLTVADFAHIAGIARQNAHAAIKRGKYQGYALRLHRIEEDGRQIRVVDVQSLPPLLRETWRELSPMPEAETVPAPIEERPARVELPTDFRRIRFDDRDIVRARWKLEVITPALRFPDGSPERGAAIDDIASRHYVDPDGTRLQPSRRTVERWLTLYRRNGLNGLCKRVRADRGDRRTVLTREWDATCPLEPEKRDRVVTEIEHYTRSLWASGVPGWSHVVQIASAKLHRLCVEAGWDTEGTRAACMLSRRWVERLRANRLVAISDRDAKAYFDYFLPRIKRTREGLMPMDIVGGDILAVDIAYRDGDRVVFQRMIAWHDVATNRVWATLIKLAKGEGVKQIHVAMSFASLVRAWGLPRRLYLDNGSEYKWDGFIAGFANIARMAAEFEVDTLDRAPELRNVVGTLRTRFGAVMRARPYNAPAKPIEGLFGNLERGPLSMIRGWVGGDRMRQKTQNVGKAPVAFDEGPERFHEAIDTALSYYHTRQQRGWLAGKSPNEAYQAAIDAGWKPVQVDPDALLVAFADRHKRTVDRGTVSVDGTSYYHDKLLEWTGREVAVRIARHHQGVAFVFDPTEQEFIAAAQPEAEFGFLDGAGATEQARRAKALRRVVSDMRRHTDRLDLEAELAAFVEGEAPPPALPDGIKISLTDAQREMIAVTRAATERRAIEDAEKRAKPRLSMHGPEETEEERARRIGWKE